MIISQIKKLWLWSAVSIGIVSKYSDEKNNFNMENVLTTIHGRFVKLPEEKVRRNKKILEFIVSTFIAKMREKNKLFDALYERPFYGGSFYDDLRVGEPDEFDLDLLLYIPDYAKPEINCSPHHGYVTVKVNSLDNLLRQPEGPKYKDFRKHFLDKDDYLSTDKTRRWAEGLVMSTIREVPYVMANEMGTFYITPVKAGPALTLKVVGPDLKIDIDLVMCFVFRDQWPIDQYYRSNPFPDKKPEFFIVPKEFKKLQERNPQDEKNWRLSFQEQERELIKGKERLKSTVRLIKKMRDALEHKKIASYYIKTVFLHLIQMKELSFWNKPLRYVFMECLKEYQKFIERGEIPYYWNRGNNLLDKIGYANLQNINGKLKAIIRDIENHADNHETVAKYLCMWCAPNIFYRLFLVTKQEREMFANNETIFEDKESPNSESKCSIL